eukprot:sb/3470371/
MSVAAASLMGDCVISQYDVWALGELFGECLFVTGVLLFFQYADKDDHKPHVTKLMALYDQIVSLIPERATALCTGVVCVKSYGKPFQRETWLYNLGLISRCDTPHYVVKTRICPIGITRFSVFCAILLASLGERARLRVLSNTLNDASQFFGQGDDHKPHVTKLMALYDQIVSLIPERATALCSSGDKSRNDDDALPSSSRDEDDF